MLMRVPGHIPGPSSLHSEQEGEDREQGQTTVYMYPAELIFLTHESH